MKTTKITVVLLAVTIFVLASVPLASAAPMFHERWWQGTFTFKGYRYTTELGNALGDHISVTIKVWLYTEGTSSPSGYNVAVCGTTRPFGPDNWGWEVSPILATDQYYKDQPQSSLWNFDNGTDLTVMALPYVLSTHPILLIKVKSETQGSMSSVSCSAHGLDSSQGPLETLVLGTCTLNATTIDQSKVSKKVPQLCLDQLPLP